MPNKTLKRRMRAAGLVATGSDAKKEHWYKHLTKAEKREIVKRNIEAFNAMSGKEKQDARVQKVFENTFTKLVPDSGPAATKAGEALRAMGRIQYRYYNDGDVFNKGYGRETVNPSYKYLTNKVNHPGVQEALTVAKKTAKWTGAEGGHVDALVDLKKEVLRYASKKNGMRKVANKDDSR